LEKSLLELAIGFDRLHQPSEALAAGEESVKICRELVASSTVGSQAALSSSLNTTGALLFGMRRFEEALAANTESIAIDRELVSRKPGEGQRHRLAVALANRSECLSALGRDDEALVAAEEAVGLLRELASRPGSESVHALFPLAHALLILSHRLEDLGRLDESLAARAEAKTTVHQRWVGVRRPLWAVVAAAAVILLLALALEIAKLAR
jgi:tetratricopeptide (TPR) repeat protein